MDARVGSQTVYQNVIFANQNLTSLLAALQAQASTGKKFANVSDDPAAALTVLSNTDQDQRLTTHLTNIQSATTSLNTSVSALQQVDSIFAQAKSLAIQATNSANNASGFGAMAQQVNALLNSLLSAANTQNNGVYIFGGAAYNKQPYIVTSQNASGDPQAVAYQASNDSTSTIVDNSQSVPVYYAGNDVFRANNRQPAVFTGNTGAQAGSGTDSATGQSNLIISHTGTTFAFGSGIQAGSSSVSGDTILGSHSLQITDTSGTGAAGTISLDGGPAVAFTSADTNLQVTNANGDAVYLDSSAITPGFNGTVAVTSSGSMSIDGGATSTPITFAPNQTVTDSTTGAVTFVDTTNVQRIGNESVSQPGTYDAFQVLIALRDDLNNVGNLPSADQIQAISSRIADLDNVSTHIDATLGTQSATLQSLTSLQSHLQDLQLSTKETISTVGDADVTDVVVKMQAYEQQLQLSLMAFAKISSTSLLNYLQ
jgi:flagellar hook-associated protein 3 FlgL